MYPLDTAAAAGLQTALVAKPETELEPLVEAHPDAEVIREPETPTHPLLGVLAALEVLGEPIVVCPCDTPHLTPALLTQLAASPATVANAGRGAEPLIGRWEPDAIPALRRAIEAGTSAQDLVSELEMASLAVGPGLIANVNTGAELALSEARLRS